MAKYDYQMALDMAIQYCEYMDIHLHQLMNHLDHQWMIQDEMRAGRQTQTYMLDLLHIEIKAGFKDLYTQRERLEELLHVVREHQSDVLGKELFQAVIYLYWDNYFDYRLDYDTPELVEVIEDFYIRLTHMANLLDQEYQRVRRIQPNE
ncbi:hypothetical protein [Hutsoniella sourekii]|uniref:hypothetical protein n=1 Tax=Hutsoniella sourekii TaxID=87650 RepID=UPI0004831305|nr:hypothetical protein [Hutsoniella sourekii]